ncbi:MAG: hypothetical protein LBD37_10890 [Treponema sp.]|jgi:hypothetical protein|nr:hypothetical protein [Treponema sp.]
MKWNSSKRPGAIARAAALFRITAPIAVITLALAGCGGNSPKALAKQSYDTGQQALGALFNPAKAAELEKKAADIEKKVAKLSAADRAVYDAELARLAGAGLGGLFEAAGKTLESVNAKDAQKALDAAGGLIDTAQDAQKTLDAARDSADAAQEALNALNALGN